MDCEGCEADVILNSKLDFEKVIFESHSGKTNISHETLVKKLENDGYKCKTKGIHSKDLAVIYCSKQ
ncbi:hypothetical protein [Caldisphaera lagunensis]|uniref:hypothetical protein n=1 Tax=Caldisphaera lagunensis TaxID=200415 RepID=UPI000662088F|nr:hypothetical protein [Caldisphaera lagunensis]